MKISPLARRSALAALIALVCAPCAQATRIFIDFGDGNFDASGNFFPLDESHDVDVDPNLSVGPIALPFGVDFGNGTVYHDLFINENGAVSFGSAIPGGSFVSATSLANLGVPVIAPFYSDLIAAPTDGDDANIIPGQVFYSIGQADPAPDSSGAFSLGDLVDAVRITWFDVASATTPGTNIFTQLYLYAAPDNGFDIRFAYGDPDFPGGGTTPALDALAGFHLGSFDESLAGPFGLEPSFLFSFRGGQLVGGTTPPPTVPEPPAALLAALGLGAAALLCAPRRRRVLVTR